MVKNTIGGSKTKGQARKHLTCPASHKLRLAESNDELYAKVTSIFGNGMVEVICIDNIKRICHIRGKFRGRGKRDNFIGRDSWILVGKREWENDEIKMVKGKVKLSNCDLLEVYSDNDINRLKSLVDIDWSVFTNSESASGVDTNEVSFTNDVINELLLEKTQDVVSIGFESNDDTNIVDINDI